MNFPTICELELKESELSVFLGYIPRRFLISQLMSLFP